MKTLLSQFLIVVLMVQLYGCRQLENKAETANALNEMDYATGLKIRKYEGYSVVDITNPWPNANRQYKYILKDADAKIPDSLKSAIMINVPIDKIIATSTTHIPSLEMLGLENSLIGFPNLDYISSTKVRSRIDAGHVKNVGNTQNLNTEIILGLAPNVIMAHGIDNNNPALDNLQKSGLKIIYNGDWNEQTALGKAEWIKLFGVLYGKEAEANMIFENIEKEYNSTLALAAKVVKKPTVLSGALYENRWYLPQGESWGAVLIMQAGGNYLWADTKGTGSLSLNFESVLDKGSKADIWIGPGQYVKRSEMLAANPHYSQFNAFKTGEIYSYSSKKGATGGIIYFELAPNRPDLVIKDLVKILHPELLPNHTLYFFEKVN